jgi:hypothetical protein
MHLTLLLSDQCSAASATTALELLSRQPVCRPAHLRDDTASLDGGGHLRGQTLHAELALGTISHTDLVLVPGFCSRCATPCRALAATPTGCASSTPRRRTGLLCTGAFMLAETGLLDDARATTHWALADLFRRRYPQIRMAERDVLCEDNRVITSGGAGASAHLLLHLIRRYGSLELAQKCSRYLLIDSAPTEQSVYVMWNMPKAHGDADILRCRTGWKSITTSHWPSTNWPSASASAAQSRAVSRRRPVHAAGLPADAAAGGQAPAGIDPHESGQHHLQGGLSAILSAVCSSSASACSLRPTARSSSHRPSEWVR